MAALEASSRIRDISGLAFSVIACSTNKTSAGTLLDGRFEVLSTLGNGTISVVVAARHLQLRKMVAIKMLRPEYARDPNLVTRFLREARAAACLRNEHVVSVTDVGILPTNVPYLIMEYLQGTDLAAHLAQHGPVPVERAVEYVLQVLEALAEAHRVGIIHRDIKPANLLLTEREDGSLLVKVLDFGVAKLTGPEYTADGLTKQSPLLRSPAYMSPEQIVDPSDVDVRSDIWALGVVFYQLILGRSPFSGRTTPELLSEICAPQPTPISALVSRAPLELVSVIGRCLHKKREGRYANVHELAFALAPFVSTSAARVSLERVLAIAGASQPVALAFSDRPSTPPSVTNTYRDKNFRAALPRTGHRNVALALAGLICAGAIGWGVFSRGAGISRAAAPAPGVRNSGDLCVARAASHGASNSNWPATGADCSAPPSEATPGSLVRVPAVAGAIQSPAGARRRTSPGPLSQERDSAGPAEASETRSEESVRGPPPRAAPGDSGERPLDPNNPYTRR